MTREVEYTNELTRINHVWFLRESRALIVMWALFHVVFTILNVVVFVQPQWIGDDGDSAVAGFFGLYSRCLELKVGFDFDCQGDMLDWDTILNKFFKANAVLTGLSCLLSIFVVMCMLFFILLDTSTVLRVCAWFQMFSGFFMTAVCILFPAGWDEETIRSVCGGDAGVYDLGECKMRWGYFLAIVLVFDAFIMAGLAFALAAKRANKLPNTYDMEKEPIVD